MSEQYTARRKYNLDQSRAPLAEAVMCHADLRESGAIATFHFPGHKGRSQSEAHARLFGRALLHDLTEIPGLDDLHSPSGVIKQAQELAADAFGASKTFFLVGGASAGVIASICAALPQGGRLALPRNSHRSSVSALVLSGAEPCWVVPDTVEELGIPLPCSAAALDAKGAHALLVQSPTYEGLCADLSLSKPSIMIVDEAHGGHLYFSPCSPKGALGYEPDAVVHGAHKTLGSLTGTGLLHLKGERLDVHRLSTMLMQIQTSSASYLMMASLDLARRQMALLGPALFSVALEEVQIARQELRAKGIEYLYREHIQDDLKFVVPSLQFRMTGATLMDRLREAGVWVEYAGLLHVVAVFSVGDTQGSGLRLANALEQVSLEVSRGGQFDDRLETAIEAAHLLSALGIPEMAMLPRQAWQARHNTVSLSQSAGQVAAESIYAYPPGNALIVKGEVIPRELPSVLKALQQSGIRFQGPADPRVDSIRVVIND